MANVQAERDAARVQHRGKGTDGKPVYGDALMPVSSNQKALLMLSIACGLAMGTGWTVSHRPLSRITPVLGALLSTLNLVCIGVFLAHARRSPGERPGLGRLLSMRDSGDALT